MRYIFAIIIFLSACNLCNAQSVAQTPPMGWNSYNCYGSAVHEDEVKANADYVAQNLKKYGWQYIVVDFLWSYDNPPGSNIGNPFQKRLQDGSYIPLAYHGQMGQADAATKPNSHQRLAARVLHL